MLLLLGLAASASGQSAGKAALSPELQQLLRTQGRVEHSLSGGAGPELMPTNPWKEQVQAELAALKPTMGVEMLRLYEHSGVDYSGPQELLRIYNTLHAVSTLEGIQYYSVTHRRMRMLFSAAYAVDGPDSRQPIPDPHFTDIPPYSYLYVFQQDLTFGTNINIYEYYCSDGYILVKSKNLTPIRYFLFPVVQPDHYITYILLVPQAGKILFYGLMGVQLPPIFASGGSTEASLYNRLTALYEWFVGRLGRGGS
jgi:hypothetical protein